MKFSAHKDNKRRQLYKNWEHALISVKALALESRYVGATNSHFRRDVSKIKMKNRCTLTSRSKGILSFFKLSRMTFKEKASFGHLAGIRRSSW